MARTVNRGAGLGASSKTQKVLDFSSNNACRHNGMLWTVWLRGRVFVCYLDLWWKKFHAIYLHSFEWQKHFCTSLFILKTLCKTKVLKRKIKIVIRFLWCLCTVSFLLSFVFFGICALTKMLFRKSTSLNNDEVSGSIIREISPVFHDRHFWQIWQIYEWIPTLC